MESNTTVRVQRDRKLDIVKGIGVICVVLSHCGFPFSAFIYQFHNCLFFIASGYFWKEAYSDDFKGLRTMFFRKAKTLWLSYVLWNGFFVLFNNLFCLTGFYITDPSVYDLLPHYVLHGYMSVKETLIELLKVLVFMGAPEVGGASWFFRVLFGVTVGYGLLEFLLKKVIKDRKALRITEAVLAIVFSVLGSLGRKYAATLDGNIRVLVEDASICVMVYAVFFFGVIFRQGIALYLKKFPAYILFLVGTAGSVGLSFCSIHFLKAEYGIISSILGFLMVWGLAYYLEKFIRPLGTGFSYIGVSSMAIFMGHFASFKIGNMIVTAIEGLPRYYYGCFSIVDPRYWPIYMVCGVTIPLLINAPYQAVKKKIKSMQTKKQK